MADTIEIEITEVVEEISVTISEGTPGGEGGDSMPAAEIRALLGMDATITAWSINSQGVLSITKAGITYTYTGFTP